MNTPTIGISRFYYFEIQTDMLIFDQCHIVSMKTHESGIVIHYYYVRAGCEVSPVIKTIEICCH